jgi:hypothetical protein
MNATDTGDAYQSGEHGWSGRQVGDQRDESELAAGESTPIAQGIMRRAPGAAPALQSGQARLVALIPLALRASPWIPPAWVWMEVGACHVVVIFFFSFGCVT